jgi:hypothetical protein
MCLEEDEAELRDIFRHELQHVCRHDFVFNALASACRSLLFFHPAAWYAMRRLNLESELACDLAVVGNRPERRASYAECLVRFARLRATADPTPWNLDFAGSSVQLKVRVRSMLTGTKSIPGWMLGLRAGFALLLIAAFVDVAPSLSVVMSYEHPRAAQPDVSVLPVPMEHAERLSKTRTTVVLRQRAAHADQAPAEATPLTAADAQADTGADAAPMTMRARRAAPSGSDPMLKRRGDSDAAGAANGPRGKTILLSTEPTSASDNSLARRASVASAITAGVSEAAKVVSHGRDKEVH